jgi:hypothetical protein
MQQQQPSLHMIEAQFAADDRRAAKSVVMRAWEVM